MKEPLKILFFMALLVIVIAGNYFFLQEEQKAATVEYSECQLSKGGCEVIVDNKSITVSIEGEIKALKQFTLHLFARDIDLLNAHVNFKMKAMDMGVNQYTFVKQAEGEWLADVVIPICTAGRRDWLVELEFLIKNGQHKVVFEVII